METMEFNRISAHSYGLTAQDIEIVRSILQSRDSEAKVPHSTKITVLIDGKLVADKQPVASLSNTLERYTSEATKSVEIRHFQHVTKPSYVAFYLLNAPAQEAAASKPAAPMYAMNGLGEHSDINSLLDEKIAQAMREKELKELKEKVEKLEAQKTEYIKTIEELEDELEEIKNEIPQLSEHASLGKNIMEGIKMAVPLAMENPKVQQILSGRLPKGEEPAAGNPAPEYSAAELSLMAWAKEMQSKLGEHQFMVVSQIVGYLAENQHDIQEVINFLQSPVEEENTSSN